MWQSCGEAVHLARRECMDVAVEHRKACFERYGVFSTAEDSPCGLASTRCVVSGNSAPQYVCIQPFSQGRDGQTTIVNGMPLAAAPSRLTI